MPLTLELTATKVRISGASRGAADRLQRMFSYTDPNETRFDEHGLPYQTQLIQDNTANIGLLKSIVEQLRYTGDRVTIVDKRPKYTRQHDWKMVLPLRRYQELAARKLLKYKYGFLQIPPRGGKTRVFAAVLAELGISPVVILSNTTALAAQTAQALQEALPAAAVGLVGGGEFALGQVTSSTYQSVYRALGEEYDGDKDPFYVDLDATQNEQLAEQWRRAKVICVDEGRIVESPSLRTILSHAQRTMYRLALDATPWQKSGIDIILEDAIGPVIAVVPYDELIEQGFLMYPDILSVKMPTVKWALNKRGDPEGGWSRLYRDLVVRNDFRNDLLARAALSLNNRGQSIFLPVAHIQHGKELQGRIPGSVFMKGAGSVQNYTDTLDALRRLEILTLITTVSTAGLDIPTLTGVAVSDGFHDERRNMQRFRQITALPGKTRAVHIDPLDQGPYIDDHARARLRQYRKFFPNSIREVTATELLEVLR